MSSEFYRLRMLEHDRAVKKLDEPLKQIIGKKRKYSEAIGKDNDYEVVQDPDIHIYNRGDYWADAYIEQNKK